MNKLLKKRITPVILASLFAGGLTVKTQAADPVITDPLKTTIGFFTGGDLGEGLDLKGNFVYALSIGADADFVSDKIQDVQFLGLLDSEVPGATLSAQNRIKNWYVVNYGDSANDDALEAATSSIRWSGSPNFVTLTLDNLQIGTEYKFQMMFGEQCCNRGFDIFFDDALVVKDFNPGVAHERVAQGDKEALVTYTYTPKSSTVVLRFDGSEASPDYSDHNAILNAVTVEKLGLVLDTDKDGMPDDYEKSNGFNPNDASDAAKDFDKDGATNLQEFVAGTDPIDVTKPVLVSAATSGDFKTVTLTFSEAVEAVSAATLANYAFSPNLAVTAASVKKNVVTLTTAVQTPGAVAYTITVNNVVDASKNAVVSNSKASFYSFLNIKDGVLKFSFWGKINGTPVDNLYQDPRWPASPDYIKAVFAFNSRDALPSDANENYGASMEGFLTPTESGSYRFFIYSDDASQFFISSDDKEANLAQVAEETGCCNFFTEPDSARTSEPVALTAGKKYFVRLVYKEGGGGDYGQIAWRKEGDTTGAGKLTPIPGKFLSAAVDLPSDPAGAYTQVSPAANAKGVSPAASVTMVHRDGKTAWTAANVSLKYDGQTVIPTVTKDGTVITIKYTPPALSVSLAVHTVSLGYLDAGGKAATLDYSFTSGAYSGTTEDKVGAYPGLLLGSAVFTADGAGATGKAGDKAINLTMKGGPVVSFNSAFLAKVNAATANDELTVAFWQKKLDVADSSAFTMNSPGSGSGRGFHAHAPWSNQHIYFDTVGCCNGTTQRIEAGIDTFSGYSGDSSWWTNAYHMFVFTKKGASKNIWVDGKLFLSGESTAALPVDIDAFYMGSGANGGEISHAIIDDFSVYGKELVEADIVALSKGTLPTALPAAKGLIAYWDFNAAPAAVIGNLKAALGANGKVKITFDGAGTLQTSTTLNGAFADSAIKSGDEITVDGAALFIRAKR